MYSFRASKILVKGENGEKIKQYFQFKRRLVDYDIRDGEITIFA